LANPTGHRFDISSHLLVHENWGLIALNGEEQRQLDWVAFFALGEVA
jgi:hypothetical protein